MADEFPNFSLRTTQELEKYFLDDLVNQEESEVLAAINLEAVKVTDKVESNRWKSRQKYRSKQT